MLSISRKTPNVCLYQIVTVMQVMRIHEKRFDTFSLPEIFESQGESSSTEIQANNITTNIAHILVGLINFRRVVKPYEGDNTPSAAICEAIHEIGSQKNTIHLNSMLSLFGSFGYVFGSLNAVCAQPNIYQPVLFVFREVAYGLHFLNRN